MLSDDLTFYCYGFDGDLIGVFTSAVSEYEQENMEGPYTASFIFSESDGVSREAMRAWFDRRIMNQVSVVYEGVEVWRGYIWSMELEDGRIVMSRTMEDFANAIAATHNEQSADTSFVDFYHAAAQFSDGVEKDENDSIWALVPESIKRYGRIETVINTNGSDGEGFAIALTATRTMPDPFTNAIVYRPGGETRLTITVVGRMVIANRFMLLQERLRYHPDYQDLSWGSVYGADGSEWTIGDEIRRIVETVDYNSGWLYAEKIADNDTPTRVGVAREIGAFDRLLELSQIQDSDGNRYQIIISNDGGVTYEKESTTPKYWLRTAQDGIENVDGTAPKWEAKPGIVKSVFGMAGPNLPTTWLDDNTLIPVERVTMRDGDEFASFNERELNQLDELAKYYAHRRWVRESYEEDSSNDRTTLR